jgi:dGTPase
MRLESPYCGHDGLNLTWELLEGLAKHNGPVRNPGWALQELDAAFPLDLGNHSSLEAQVAAIADDIAYDNHDIDDGLRAGFLTLDQLTEQPFVAEQWYAVEQRYQGAPRDRQLRELVRSQIGIMVNDVIAETRRRIEGLETVDQPPCRPRLRRLLARDGGGGASPEALHVSAALLSPRSARHRRQGQAGDGGTVHRLRADPSLMGEDWLSRMPEAEPGRSRHIADYIAGMTDRFAIARYAQIHGSAPEGSATSDFSFCLGQMRPVWWTRRQMPFDLGVTTVDGALISLIHAGEFLAIRPKGRVCETPKEQPPRNLSGTRDRVD